MAIERDSFSHPWPGSAYRRELQENSLAHYLVLRCPSDAGPPAVPGAPEHVARRSLPSTLLRLTGRLLGNDVPAPATQITLAGYAGLWLMVDEAHVTTIAVRPQFRGRGFGELLLVSLAEVAMEIGARWLTLEVRVSNEVAQRLYRKYGFRPAGVRQKYYSDNQEDALIMWTDELSSAAFQTRYNENKETLLTRLRAGGDLAP
jgi:ribosomal-protein-alanine N-acetyltransferase